MRQKMTIAVRNLGLDVESAPGGAEGLARLSDPALPAVDLVLLDIVMPEVDGFEVLRRIRADPVLREVEVLVVSSLEELDDAVRAIELGATDFLTKSVDHLLLRARVGACLERRRLRLRELDTLAQVARLAEAARRVEADVAAPGALGLEDLATRDDALGDLARVFSQMAAEVARREMALRRQVRLLKGTFLLLCFAVPYSLFPTLSRMLSKNETHPVGESALILLGGAILMLAISAARGRMPSITAARLAFAARVALIGTVLPQVMILWVAGELGASTITILLATEPLFAFGLAAALGLERANATRFLGICFGLAAVGLITFPELAGSQAAAWVWMGLAASVALLFACEDILFAKAAAHPDDAIQTVTLILAVAAVMTVGLAAAMGVMPPLGALVGAQGPLLPALAAISSGCTILLVMAIQRLGAVFASLASVPLAVAGVVWAVALLGEEPPPTLWAALALMVGGLVLVRPREPDPAPREA